MMKSNYIIVQNAFNDFNYEKKKCYRLKKKFKNKNNEGL